MSSAARPTASAKETQFNGGVAVRGIGREAIELARVPAGMVTLVEATALLSATAVVLGFLTWLWRLPMRLGVTIAVAQSPEGNIVRVTARNSGYRTIVLSGIGAVRGDYLRGPTKFRQYRTAADCPSGGYRLERHDQKTVEIPMTRIPKAEGQTPTGEPAGTPLWGVALLARGDLHRSKSLISKEPATAIDTRPGTRMPGSRVEY
jgi:hypothetical protein